MDKLVFLRNRPLFDGVDEAAVAEISQYVFEKQLKRGDAAMKDDNKDQALYFVAEGAMKIFKISADGKEQILALMRPGDFFNEVLLDDGPPIASAEALGAVLLYGIRKSDLRVIMRQHYQVASNLLNMLAWRVRYLISLVEDLSFRTVPSRVAKILLENAKVTDGTRLTQRDMAALAGTAREVVSRSLKYLETRGFIEMRKRQIVLKNVNGLKELADPNI